MLICRVGTRSSFACGSLGFCLVLSAALLAAASAAAQDSPAPEPASPPDSASPVDGAPGQAQREPATRAQLRVETGAASDPTAPTAPEAASRVEVAEAEDSDTATDEDADDDGHSNGGVAGVSPQAQSFDGDPWGDDSSDLAAGPLTFRLALQTRYRETFAKASQSTRAGFALREDVLVQDGDGFKLQRFLMRMEVEPKKWLRFKGTLDFAKLRGSNVSNVVKQAIATLRVIPKRIEVVAGVFKIPYSILELDPVARYELTEFGDSNELINNLGFAGRDVGVAVMFAPLGKPKWMRLVLSTFRGHAKDEHSTPLGVIAARVESKPWIKGLRFGFSVVGMPYSFDYKQPFETSSRDVLPDPPDPLFPREELWASGKAYGADISYSKHRFTFRVEGLLGDRVDVNRRYGALSYSAIWALVAYRFKIGKIGLMPAARLELMDADREHDYGGRRLLSFGLNLLYKKSVRFVVDVSNTAVQAESPVIEQPRPLPYYPYMALDNTRITFQLQLEL